MHIYNRNCTFSIANKHSVKVSLNLFSYEGGFPYKRWIPYIFKWYSPCSFVPQTRGFQEPDDHLVEFCLSKAIYLTSSCPTILTQEVVGGAYHKDHFNNWKFLLIYHSFQDIEWKLLKKKSFFPFKGNNSYKESSDNFHPWRLL